MSDLATGAPIPFTQILDESLKLTMRHVRTILLPIAIPVSLIAGLMPLAQGFLYRGMPMQPGAVPNLAVLASAGIAFFAVMLLFMATQYAAGVATIVAAATVVAGKPLSLREAWLFPFRLSPLGTMLLVGLATILGTLLCCLPGIYVGLVLSLTIPVMVFETQYGPDAMRRSYALTTYNPSGDFTADPRVKIFVLGVVTTLVGMALSFVVQIPAMIVQQVFMLHAMSQAGDKDLAGVMAKVAWMQVPTQMIAAAIQRLTGLYMAFGVALLYVDARNRKEGTDLEQAIDRLVAPTADAPAAPSPVSPPTAPPEGTAE